MDKIIGIDPGKNTGLAIAENGQLIKLMTTDFWGAVETIERNADAVIVIELPANKHIFHKGAQARGAIGRTGINVGSVIREAELLIQYLHRNDREHIIQRPQGKKNAAEFKKITGWTGRTNQHERDAAMMIHGLIK